MEKDTLVSVTNRDNGSVGYQLADYGPGFHRSFSQGETKMIPFDELQKLMYAPGGKVLLEDCLIINDEEARQELLPNVEPEYFYTEADVKKLLLEGTLDQLLDCLQFAPLGVKELVKSLAVKFEINDIAKRNAIYEKTGFNVNKAIEVNHMAQEPDTNDEKKSEETGRRAAPISSAPTRKTDPVTAKNYKVVK